VDKSGQLGHAGGLAQLSLIGSSLRLDLAAAEAIDEFELAGVQAVLLKGRSIARWLYPGTADRSYRDCDLLVPAGRFELAAETLVGIGYERSYDDCGMPSWWREHAETWFRVQDGTTLDLHRTLPGVSVRDEEAWRVLSAHTETMPVGGRTVRVLALPARALHVALHAAQHGAEWDEPMADLSRALASGDDYLWSDAAKLAAELGALDAFAAGLHLLPLGTAVAERLGLLPTWSVDAQLRASSAPATALTVERLAAAGSFRERLEIGWRKLVPPAEFIRLWDHRATRSRAALVRAYARRPLWLVRVAPGSVKAWRRARKSVRGSARTASR
jgi:hypothetical protein